MSRILLLYRSYILTAIAAMLAAVYVVILIGHPLGTIAWTLAILLVPILLVYALLSPGGRLTLITGMLRVDLSRELPPPARSGNEVGEKEETQR